MISRSQFRQSKAIQFRTGRTFHVATRFLPDRIRESTYVLYAFFRIADQVVDDPDPAPPADQRTELERIRAAALGNRQTEDPVLSAFSTVREREGIPDREINEFIDAMLADIDRERYDTFEDLSDYLRGSAVAVANMMLEVMDPPQKEQARPHAAALGEAFQLTNFIRDVDQDYREFDRIYLPRETLERHGLDETAIERGEFSPNFAAVIEDELARAEERYRHGVAGIAYLPPECQFPVLLAAVLYAEHHRKIRALGGNVLDHHQSLTPADYFRVIPKTWWKWRTINHPEPVFYDVSPVPYRSAADPARGDVREMSRMLKKSRFSAVMKSWGKW